MILQNPDIVTDIEINYKRIFNKRHMSLTY